MKVRYRARALADIDDINGYIEQRSPTGARNVLASIHVTIRSITEQPFASEQTDHPDIRVKFVRRYRYKVFYRIIDRDTVEIIHVRHTSRRPWEGT